MRDTWLNLYLPCPSKYLLFTCPSLRFALRPIVNDEDVPWSTQQVVCPLCARARGIQDPRVITAEVKCYPRRTVPANVKI